MPGILSARIAGGKTTCAVTSDHYARPCESCNDLANPSYWFSLIVVLLAEGARLVIVHTRRWTIILMRAPPLLHRGRGTRWTFILDARPDLHPAFPIPHTQNLPPRPNSAPFRHLTRK